MKCYRWMEFEMWSPPLFVITSSIFLMLELRMVMTGIPETEWEYWKEGMEKLSS